MKKLVLMVLICSVSTPIFSDIPWEKAYKPYTPTFVDWVHVSFHIKYEVANDPHYSVRVSRESADGEIRFVFSLFYATSEIGLKYHKETWPRVMKDVEFDCQTWAIEGYSISLNDIVFTEQRGTY